jgi:predicted nucleotide-binding protein
MRPSRAIDELGKLRAQADTPQVQCQGPEHRAWKAKVDAVIQGSLGKDLETLREFRDLPYHLGVWTGVPGEAQEDARFFSSAVMNAAALIDAAIYQLELQNEPDERRPQHAEHETKGPIFVVHGHDGARKYELMRLLDRAVEPTAMILHEETNGGTMILEKLERHAQTAGFAVVLLTGDDEGRLRSDDTRPLSPRGRQNVIFELGVFIGLLGRAHVAVLKDPDVEDPSDINGLVYIQLDAAGAWRHTLLKELRAAGITVYFERIP